MDLEEMREDLEMIRKGLELIENRAFAIMQNLEAYGESVPVEFVGQFRRAHEELADMVNHLADLAGLEQEED
jgi:phosphate uptake regulator